MSRMGGMRRQENHADQGLHDLAEKLQTSGKSGDVLADRLHTRAHKPLFPHPADLDSTALGKRGHVATPVQTHGFIP